MPRFFFHVHDDIQTRDAQGAVLPNLGAARAEAKKRAQALAAETVRRMGRISLSHFIEIEDENGETLNVLFGEAVTVCP